LSAQASAGSGWGRRENQTEYFPNFFRKTAGGFRGIQPLAHVRFGSFAAEPFRVLADKCPLLVDFVEKVGP